MNAFTHENSAMKTVIPLAKRGEIVLLRFGVRAFFCDNFRSGSHQR
jgi:hypothetical protein